MCIRDSAYQPWTSRGAGARTPPRVHWSQRRCPAPRARRTSRNLSSTPPRTSASSAARAGARSACPGRTRACPSESARRRSVARLGRAHAQHEPRSPRRPPGILAAVVAGGAASCTAGRLPAHALRSGRSGPRTAGPPRSARRCAGWLLAPVLGAASGLATGSLVAIPRADRRRVAESCLDAATGSFEGLSRRETDDE